MAIRPIANLSCMLRLLPINQCRLDEGHRALCPRAAAHAQQGSIPVPWSTMVNRGQTWHPRSWRVGVQATLQVRCGMHAETHDTVETNWWSMQRCRCTLQWRTAHAPPCAVPLHTHKVQRGLLPCTDGIDAPLSLCMSCCLAALSAPAGRVCQHTAAGHHKQAGGCRLAQRCGM